MYTTRRTFLTALGSAGIAIPTGLNAATNWTGKLRALQGPMLGAIEPDRARVWARIGGEHEVALQTLGPDGHDEVGPTVRARASNDYCVVLESPPLQPATRYEYRIRIDGKPDAYLKDDFPTFLKTAPAGATRFKVAFGSCCKYQDDPEQAVWKGVATASPDLFFWLGDNVYIDSLHEQVMAETYRRQRDILAATPALRGIPQLATWDDHDFCLNDHDRRNPVKDTALAVFERYWANPGYGQAGDAGVYFNYRYGGVEFFFLDVRYHRDPNDADDGPDKTMLGPQQFNWLLDGLGKSEAAFKVLVSGSGWSAAKGPTGDAWSSHLHERNRLFDEIRDRRIEGVLLISGDTHVGEFNCIPWSENGGYDFFELVSSPLAQPPEKGSFLERRPEIRIRQVYSRGNNFGLLEFDTTADDPTVTLTLRNTRGLRTWWKPVTLRASELRNGIRSWDKHIDEVSRERHESWRSGGPYYPDLAGD